MPARRKRVIEEEEESDFEEEEQTPKKRKAPAPKSRGKKASFDEEEEFVDEPSQSATKKRSGPQSTLDAQGKEKLVSDLVRFAIFQDHNKHPTRRDEVNKTVVKEHKNVTNLIIAEAKRRFADIFGFNFTEVQSKQTAKKATTATGVYVLTNALQKDVEDQEDEDAEQLIEWTEQEQAEMALLMVVLSLIYLNNHVIEQDTLFQQLKRLGLAEKEHPLFGDWTKIIETKFVRELYLDRKKSQNRADRNTKAAWEYRMGQRAEQEIGKKNVLYWIAFIYGEEVDRTALQELELENEPQEEEGSESSDSSDSDSEDEATARVRERQSQASQQQTPQRGGAGRGRGGRR